MLDLGSYSSLLATQVALLVSILVVATFVQSANTHTSSLQGVINAFWARRIWTLLIACAATSYVGAMFALGAMLWDLFIVELGAVLLFAVSCTAFALACIRVVWRFRAADD